MNGIISDDDTYYTDDSIISNNDVNERIFNQVLNESLTDYTCPTQSNKINIPSTYIKKYGSITPHVTRSVKRCLATLCAICLADFTSSDSVTYAHVNVCHIYHVDCLFRWLTINFTCPSCRVDADCLLKEI